MRRLEYEGPFNNLEWKGKVIIGRWAWFWKRIKFWRYTVIKISVPDGDGKFPVIKCLWRYK